MSLARNRFDVDETLEEPLNCKNLKKVMVYVMRCKGKMLAALILSGLGSVVGLTGPMIVSYAMDNSIPQGKMDELIRLSVLLAATILVNVGFTAIRRVIVAQASQTMVHDIRRDLFAHLQVLPFAYYDNRPHGKILVRIVHYVNNVSDVLSNGLLDFIIEIINIIFIIFFMFQVSVPLAAVTVAGLPVLFGVRGFLFAFSAACLIRGFGGGGLFPAFVLFGLPALLWAPALFLLGVQSLAGAQQLLRRTWGDGRGTLPFNRGYWLRACVCIGLSLAGGLLEYWVVPVLLRAAARVVL